MPDVSTVDPGPQSPTGSRPRVWDRVRRAPVAVWLLIAVSYVPLLLTRPGEVGADTKTYLYLDPSRLLSRAAYMWDSNIGLGTVTHQNIGYLWPMGPYYWLMETIGLPDWVAQRLWLGTIICAAGLGVRWMMRELRWDGTGVTVAAFAYALSPYLINYGARISVILLPFAGLPWLIGLAARALRRNDWATPAIFALLTLTVGGVNATSLVLVMLGPLLWFVYAWLVERSVDLRRVLAVGLRITALTLITSLWWVAGLALQGSFGIDILRYTETYETVANAALAPELMRGLGYWFFYGSDGLGPWTEASIGLVESLPILVISFLLPGLAMVAGLMTRWRHRVFFLAIILAGLVIGIGAHPWDSPSPYGALFKAFTGTDAGLSMRSTPRAAPLIALGLAVFLGAGVAAVTRWRPKAHLPLAATLIVLICVNQAALFRGQMVDRHLTRDEDVPEYWLDAADALDNGDRSTRAWELPGTDFASYRWGNTVDPIMPGLTDRDYVARELIPYGTPPSANLVNDVDMPFQSGRVDPTAIGPLARMMGVGDIVLRADLQYERYRTPRPRTTVSELRAAAGLGDPVGFGDAAPNEPTDALPLDDEMTYSIPLDAPDPNPVMIFPVLDPEPMLRTTSASAPTVFSGDASGLVALAAAGRLDPDRPVFYTAALADDPDELDAIIDEPDSQLVVSDTNRRQARRWGGVRDNDGYTERAGETPLVEDAADNRLDIVEGQSDDNRTVSEQVGGATVAASAYGNGVTYTSGDRAVFAVDHDPSTAWRVAAFDDPIGEFIEIALDDPVSTDHIDLLQVQGPKNRYITQVELTFDDGDPVVVELSPASREGEGERISIGERTFSTLRVTITATDPGDLRSYRGISDVGFAEIGIEGVGPVTEIIRPPVDLLDHVGDSSIDRELTYLFTRRAANPADILANDEERSIRRWVSSPVDRNFTAYGTARIDVNGDDLSIDRLLGVPTAEDGGVSAESTARLPGDPRSRASAAIDGDSSTAYRTPMGQPAGQSLTFTYPEPVTITDLPVELVTDGRHSVPTQLSVSVDDAAPVAVPLEGVSLGEGERGTTTSVVAATGELTGTTFSITIDSVIEAESKDWFGGARTVMPAAIVELGLPGIHMPEANSPISSGCRDDLLVLDGSPVPVEISGTVGDASAARPLRLHACGDAATGVEIPAGDVLLETSAAEAFDIDMIALSSAAGGGPGQDSIAEPLPEGPTPPETTTERTGRNDYTVAVADAAEPYWVVFGQSHSAGWHAKVAGGDDLGPPTLVNGYANAWRVDPATAGADATIEISWTPQNAVWAGLWASAAGVLICVALIVAGALARRRAPAPDDEAVMRPVLAEPAAVDGPPLRGRGAVVFIVVAGLLAWIFGGLWVGLGITAVAAVGTLLRRGQLVVRIAALVTLAAAFCFIIAKQARDGYEVDFDWMNNFETAHAPTIFAVFAAGVSVSLDGLRRRATRL